MQRRVRKGIDRGMASGKNRLRGQKWANKTGRGAGVVSAKTLGWSFGVWKATLIRVLWFVEGRVVGLDANVRSGNEGRGRGSTQDGCAALELKGSRVSAGWRQGEFWLVLVFGRRDRSTARGSAL